MPKNGFTLAELLIALAVLGVIAVFTVPKVLIASQDGRYKAVVKEDVATIIQAFHMYQQEGKLSGNSWTYDLLPYFNHVSTTTSGTLDDVPGGTTTDCNAWNSSLCMSMHNGSAIWWHNCQLTGTSNQHGWYFIVDPDGKTTGKADSLGVVLYADGRIKTLKVVNDEGALTISSCGWWFLTGSDPSYFNWN